MVLWPDSGRGGLPTSSLVFFKLLSLSVLAVMTSPDDADNDAKEEDVDEDGDDGRDGQEEDTLARVHPTVGVLVVMSAHKIGSLTDRIQFCLLAKRTRTIEHMYGLYCRWH